MKKIALRQLPKMKSPEIITIIKNWKRYDPRIVLIAYSELHKRKYNIPQTLNSKTEEFCNQFNHSNIEEFLNTHLKDDNYYEFYKQEIDTLEKTTIESNPLSVSQKNKETESSITRNQFKSIDTKSITSITFILIGNMLTTYGVIGGDWTASLTAVFGLILFFIGLTRFKNALDNVGKKGARKLIWAAIIGIVANIFSYIPLLGIILVGILNTISFIIQVIGLFNLKNSTILNSKGSSGVNYLLGAMFLMIIASLFNIIPFAGSYIKSFVAFIALIIIPFGWLKIQEAIIESRN